MADIVNWVSKNCRVDKSSPFPGYWNPVSSPWIQEPLRAFADTETREVVAVAAAQTSKTLFSLFCMAYAIAENPVGGCMYIQPTQIDAEKIARQRVIPFLKNIDLIAEMLPADRHSISLSELDFEHMSVNIISANSLSQLQGKPAAYIIADEIRLYQNNEAVPLLMKRVRTFYNHKILMVSCPNTNTDTLWSRYSLGTMEEYNVPCPHCNKLFVMVFKDCIKWDNTLETDDVNAIAKTVYMECPNCHGRIEDNAAVRNNMINNGKWIVTNTNANTGVRSFRWNCLVAPWVSWANIVTEFLNAKRSARMGLYEPLKTFVCESLSEPWNTEQTEEKFETTTEDYNPKDKPANEIERFMGCDYQAGAVGEGEYFWYSVYSFCKDHQVRLLTEGKCPDFGSLKKISEEWGVTPKRVLVDCAYNPVNVYKNASTYGFSAIRGSKWNYFNIKSKDGSITKRLWRITVDDPLRGQQYVHKQQTFNVLEFCNDPLTSITYTLINDGKRFYVYAGVSEDYKRQLKAVKRVKLGNNQWAWRISHNDHQFDVLKMAIAAAIMSGTYKMDDYFKTEGVTPIIPEVVEAIAA